MAAFSNSKESVYIWIRKIIKSCLKIEQFYACEKLIDLFEIQYKDNILTKSLRKKLPYKELI